MTSTSEESAANPERYVAKKPARLLFASTTLALEAFVVLFATVAAYALRDIPGMWPQQVAAPPGWVIWVAGGSIVVVLLVLSRLLHVPGGFVAGSVAQAVVLACGLVVPMMFLLGGIFAVLWLVSLRLGGRIDRERAAYDAAHPETAPR